MSRSARAVTYFTSDEVWERVSSPINLMESTRNPDTFRMTYRIPMQGLYPTWVPTHSYSMVKKMTQTLVEAFRKDMPTGMTTEERSKYLVQRMPSCFVRSLKNREDVPEYEGTPATLFSNFGQSYYPFTFIGKMRDAEYCYMNGIIIDNLTERPIVVSYRLFEPLKEHSYRNMVKVDWFAFSSKGAMGTWLRNFFVKNLYSHGIEVRIVEYALDVVYNTRNSKAGTSISYGVYQDIKRYHYDTIQRYARHAILDDMDSVMLSI